MKPGGKRRTQKADVQLGLFGENEIIKHNPIKRSRLSPATIACRKLALKLNKRRLICTTLIDRIQGKRINVINIIGKELETLVRTPGFNEKKFVDELSKEHIQNSDKMRKFIAECWPYKKSEEEIKKVQNAINVITTLILESSDALKWRRNFHDSGGKRRKQEFERKIRED